MKFVVATALMLLTACAIKRHVLPIFPDGHEIACSSYGYCSPNSGSYMMGSSVCYTDDVGTEQPVFNKDSKCR